MQSSLFAISQSSIPQSSSASPPSSATQGGAHPDAVNPDPSSQEQTLCRHCGAKVESSSAPRIAANHGVITHQPHAELPSITQQPMQPGAKSDEGCWGRNQGVAYVVAAVTIPTVAGGGAGACLSCWGYPAHSVASIAAGAGTGFFLPAALGVCLGARVAVGRLTGK